jgi:hypothetical protein
VATAFDVERETSCLVACHVWDTIGAQSADWQVGLILRQGNAPLDVGAQPDYIGKNINEIADQLIDKYHPEADELSPSSSLKATSSRKKGADIGRVGSGQS